MAYPATRRALLSPTPLPFQSGTAFGLLSHSYGQNGITGGTTATAQPLIKTNVMGLEAVLETIFPAIKYQKWWGFQYGTMNLASGTGTFNVGDTLTNTSTGFTGTIVSVNYSAGSGNLTLSNTTGTFAAGAVTSSSGGAATCSNVLMQNYRGANQSISGDYLIAQNGTMGIVNRVNALMTLPVPPQVVVINGALNSIVNSVAGATAVAQTQSIVTALRQHPNWRSNNIIIVLDCNPTTSAGYGSVSAVRQRTSDYNTLLASGISGWGGYGSTLFLVSLFENLLLGATGNLTTDCAAYVAGTNYADPAKMYDANHMALGGSYPVAKAIKNILVPFFANSSNFWKIEYAAATAYNGATWTATAGNISGTSVSKALGSQASGSAIAGVVTGLTINGPSNTSTVKCYLEPGTGSNGAAVGQYIQAFEYTNNGNSDTITASLNAITTGPGAVGNTSWVQCQQDVWTDASGVLSYTGLSLSEVNNTKALCLDCDATAQAKAIGLPTEAVVWGLLTPHYKLSGSQTSIKISVVFKGTATRTGAQTVWIYPTGAVKVVNDPTAGG